MNEDEHLPRTQAAFERLGDHAMGLDTAAARRAIEQRSRRRRQGFGALAVASATVVALIAFVTVRSDDDSHDVATPVSSSSTSVPSSAMSAADLDGTAWILAGGTGPSGEIPLVDGWPITLTFDGTTVTAMTACNSYSGSFDGSTIAINDATQGAALCEPDGVESEDAFLSALDGVDRVTFDEDLLTMSGPSVELVFLAPPSVPTDELIGQLWVLAGLGRERTSAMLTPAGEQATLFLDPDGTVEASTGCRSLSGEYDISGATLSFPTLVADGDCPQDLTEQDGLVMGITEQDDLVVAVLSDLAYVGIDGNDRLHLSSRRYAGLWYTAADEVPSAAPATRSIAGFLAQQKSGDDAVEVSGHLVNRGGPWVLCGSARASRAVGHFCEPPWLVVTNYDHVVDPHTDPPAPPDEAALELAEVNPDFTVDDGIVWTPEPITLTLIAVETETFGRVRAAVSGWPTEAELTAEERDLVAGFEAIEGSDPIDVGPLRLSESGVQLGLSNDLLVTRTADELTDPAAWTLDREMFRAYVGPFSALELLAGPLEATALAGSHGHCANPPMPVHSDLQGLRRLSIQPVDIDSCLQWYTVDIYLDGAGDVVGITLDVYEP